MFLTGFVRIDLAKKKLWIYATRIINKEGGATVFFSIF